MSEQICIGDKIALETRYGKFVGKVDRLDRKENQKKFSLKLRGIEVHGQNIRIPIQRFWSDEVISLQTIERISKSNVESLRNTSIQSWVENDYSPGAHISPKRSPTQQKTYRRAKYKFISTTADLQLMMPELIKVKEVGISLEPSSIGGIEQMKKIKLLTINTGKADANYIIDFEHLGSAAIKAGLGKILDSKSRLKLLVNCGEASHALSKYYSLDMVNVLDLEVFGLTVDVGMRKNVPEYFSGFTALVRKNLGDEIPREITPAELAGPTISEEVLNKAALRAEVLRPLKNKLQEQILRKAFDGTGMMMNSLRGKNEEDQTYVRNEQRRLKVDPKLAELLR